MARYGVILTAGGRGRRMAQGQPKQFLELAGRPILEHALRNLFLWLQSLPDEDSLELILTHPAGELDATAELLDSVLKAFPSARPCCICRLQEGGESRQDSVRIGLQALASDPDLVFIHDGVRPFAGPELYSRLLAACEPDVAGVVPLLPPGDTLKALDEMGQIQGSLDRERVRAVQTPQLFYFPGILELHKRAEQSGFQGTDDASLVEHFAAGTLSSVEGESSNMKITRPGDLPIAEAILEEKPQMSTTTPQFRVGQGYDVHAFAPGRAMILGGVEIPYHLGLAGHSDADVLLHAIADALLGACALGDIGRHFPDSDEAWKDADSWKLLCAVRELIAEKGWRVQNLDATLICEQPKISPHADAMRQRIAQALQVELGQVSLKATTTEKLGFTGRKEGIAAQAIVLLSL